MFYRILRALVVRPVIFGWFRLRVTGLSNVPRRGPVILASNHLAFIDSIFIPGVVKRPMTYLVASKYYEKSGVRGRLLGWFFRQVGQLALDRSGGSASKVALETGLQVLSENGLIGIYPEGTRSKDGSMHRGRTGVARLVLASGVSVIPVAIAGTNHIFVPGKKLPQRARITIHFGRPLEFETVVGDYNASRLRAVTDEIMHTIHTMTDQEYVDTYAVTRD